MGEGAQRFVIVSGAALVLIGAFLVSAAYGAEQRAYTPPPGGEASACPSHPEFLIVSADELRLAGFTLIFLGVGVVLGSATVPLHMPLTRVDEEALLERIELPPRRSD